ncbi:hypothetical protein V1506DRAFT_468355 [Lipomyces tetrasporus]
MSSKSATTKAYQNAFALFDKRGTGKVSLQALGDLLRACGQNPTLAEIEELEESVGGDCMLLQFHMDDILRHIGTKLTCLVDFETFLQVLNRPDGFRAPGEPEDYVRGFQVFDKDKTGFIGVGELRYILTSLGEKLSSEEVDELLKNVNVTKDGNVNYTDFVRMILAN